MQDVGVDATEELDDLYTEEEQPFEDRPPAVRRPESDAELETLYDTETFRIVTQRNDFLIPGLLESLKNENYLNLTPPYQRRLRWDRKRKSRLIESLLMNVPIPPVFLLETELAQYEVVDGQQRLSTIREFFNNEFPLSGLERWNELNGRRYSKLPSRIKSGLMRRSLSAVILLAESGRTLGESDQDGQHEIKRFVFERLNTGGVRLNPQEIRNAVHAGGFANLLHELSREPLFTKIWDIPPREKNEHHEPSQRLRDNIYYKQMLDCEIVLRFFALADSSQLATSMKTSLDNAMKRYSLRPPEELAERRRDFNQCLTIAYQVYGRRAFRLLPQAGGRKGTRKLSRALYDAVMVGIFNVVKGQDDVGRDRVGHKLAESRTQVMSMTERLLRDSQNYDLLVGRANTKKSVLERIELLTAVYRGALGSSE